MRTVLFLILFFLFALNGQGAFGAEGFIVPTPLERAKELVKSNKPQEALDALSSYRPSTEEFSSFHYAFAQALVQINLRYESIEHFRLAYLYAGSDADKERILFERAEVYAAMGYDSEAVICLNVFLKQFPKSQSTERAELGIAAARARLGEFREALAHFEKAGASLRARIGKANALQSLGRTQEARGIYRELIENNPEAVNSSQETLYHVGENFRQSGGLSDARVYFTSVKDPLLKYRAANGLGLIALTEGNLDAAVSAFNTAAESQERWVRREAIMNRADAQMRMGRYDEAESALLSVKNNYPYGKQYETALLLLAKLYRERGKFSESTALLKALIYQRTPPAAALDELEAILREAQEKDGDAFVKLWTDTGRWLLDPSRAATLMNVAKGLRHTGKPFLDICAWLVRYGPENAKVEGRLLLADFYADMGDAATAWGYLKRARIKKNSDDVSRIKAKVYAANRDLLNASQAIMSISEPREADLLMLLDAMQSLANREKAIAFCKRKFEKAAIATRTRVRFADILHDAGRTGEALDQYQAAVAAPQKTKNEAQSADAVWAHYRISALTQGEDKTASLKAIQTATNAVGRFAAAELKGVALRRKMKSVNR